MDNEQSIQALKEYFSKRDDVVMAFLFGSRAKSRVHTSSDWDIGVYFTPQTDEFEFECTDREYPEEHRIWADLTTMLETDNVDLVILNRAPASIADTAIRGEALVMKDRALWLRFMLLISKLAEDYRIFAREYHEIVQRSRSLLPQDRERLERLIDFLEEQATLYPVYRSFSRDEYEEDPRKRNEIERWLENMVNAVIDAGKVLLGSQKRLIPPTYREIVRRAVRMGDASDDFGEKFDQWVRLRNVLAHEYLDIKWKRLSDFAKISEPYMRQFIESAKRFLEENIDRKEQIP
ncbi:MAG: HepT-like ribonuclease domain-containing protein [Candidatus Sungiibacteriota bacterium]